MTPLSLPPGKTESVAARSVLVLAPHFDDEVLGCGGLLTQLSRSGAVVRVLFLTDGRGAARGEDGAAYGERRLGEARAAAHALGIQGHDALGLPDGGLAEHLDEAVAGVRRALWSQRPGLVLAPSPLEVSRDHRAAFAALHRVLSPLRGAEIEESGAPRVLLYEVNHPQYPDLLVEVSAELPAIESAMACYRSQEELHPYLAAAIGLRRYRALSLQPPLAAAEGYRQLSLDDFRTRSLSALVAHLGGVAELHAVDSGPLVSVIVRTKDRPRLLAEALRSLERQTYRRVEIVLVNDGGAPPVPPPELTLPVVRVELERNRGRAAAANAGLAAARGDYVTFLDDDDVAEAEHLATLAALVGAPQVRVAYTDAAVGLYELDGQEGWRQAERRLPYSRDFDAERLLVDNYIPFNTLIAERALALQAGPLDETLPFFEDWDFLIRLSRLAPFHHLPQVTCEYRHFRGGLHHVFGERPRERHDFVAVKARVIAKHARDAGPEVVARVVDALRGEAVELAEAAAALAEAAAAQQAARAALEQEVEALRRAQGELEARYHRLNGEREALGGDLARAHRENERLAAESAAHQRDGGALRQEMVRRDAELQRLYDDESALRREVDRLSALVRAMEGTRAWRLHSWWQRRRGRAGAAAPSER
jgi:LmbE family N-acetylglucosaminyl deacetylase